MTAKITLYTSARCPFCVRAERLLEAKGVVAVERVRVDLNPVRRAEMVARCGDESVPQIYIGTLHVGGYRELAALDRTGELDRLLTGEAAK